MWKDDKIEYFQETFESYKKKKSFQEIKDSV